MKNIFTTREILLMTNTTFANREYTANNNQPSKTDSCSNQLADICWNGMIPCMLPELFNNMNQSLTMWHLQECNRLLYLQLGEEAVLPDAEFTINPYVLMATTQQN